MHFDPTRNWQHNLDVRTWDAWKGRLKGEPNGAFWTIVGTRRSGKTWALAAIRYRADEHWGKGWARVVDLRQDPDPLRELNGTCLLLDEPGDYAGNHERSHEFLEVCAAHKRKGAKIVVAMTPREWNALRAADPKGHRIQPRDLFPLSSLDDAQARKLARREWAATLLDQIEPVWQRNPFLLELMFCIAESEPAWRDRSVEELCLEVVEHCRFQQYDYVREVFKDGLSDEQRDVLRRVAARESLPSGREVELLIRCGILQRDNDKRITIADPVLRAHLPPPLIIHHISDLHFGKKSAPAVHRAGSEQHTTRLGQAAGPGWVRDTYLAHVRTKHDDGPHIIMVSGDLAELGKTEEFQAARVWLETLRAALGGPPRPPRSRPAFALGRWQPRRGLEFDRRRTRAQGPASRVRRCIQRLQAPAIGSRPRGTRSSTGPISSRGSRVARIVGAGR